MSSFLSEIEHLKIVYKEIIEGYSFFDKESIYIKHLNDIEYSEVVAKKLELFEKYSSEGLPSEEEKLQQLYDSEQWTKDQEEQILQYKYIIVDNEKNLKNIIPQQHANIKRIIEDTRKKLQLLSLERSALMGITANEAAERDSSSYVIYLAFYKDKELKEKVFKSFKDIDELETLNEQSKLIEQTFQRFSDSSIRKISVLPFFLNTFSYSKDKIHTFLGKPLYQLTTYQTILFSLGNRNLNVLSQADGEPPELLDDVKVDDIITWYDQNYSVILGKRNSSK